jgi:hypothetical protein
VVPNLLVEFDEGVVMLLIVSWVWSSRHREKFELVQCATEGGILSQDIE